MKYGGTNKEVNNMDFHTIKKNCKICKKMTTFEKLYINSTDTITYCGGYDIFLYVCTKCGIIVADVERWNKFKEKW